MRLPRIPLLIVRDLVAVAGLTLVSVSLALTIVGAVVEAVRHGLDPLVVLRLAPYLLLPMLPFVLPASVLFASVVVYARMKGDNEFAALKASGIHPGWALWPALALGLTTSVAGVGLADGIIPACRRQAIRLMLTDLDDLIRDRLRFQGGFVRPELSYEIYVGEMRGDRLVDPILKHRSADGESTMIAQAAEATIEVDVDAEPPVILLRMFDTAGTTPDGGGFYLRDEYTKVIPLSGLRKERAVPIEAMSFAGCRAFAKRKRLEAVEIDRQLAHLAASAVNAGDPAPFANDSAFKRKVAKRTRRLEREANAEVHLRCCHAVVSLPFALLGCTAGLLSRRRDLLYVFFVCFLPILVFYYPSMALAVNFAKEGTSPGWAALWAPVALLMALAIPPLYRVVRY